MKVKLTGEFATLTGRQVIEIYGPTTIKGLLNASVSYTHLTLPTKA